MRSEPHKVLTCRDGTWTHDGFFPHLVLEFDDCTIQAPVCVVPAGALRDLPAPFYTRAGHAFFALPGAGRVEVRIH